MPLPACQFITTDFMNIVVYFLSVIMVFIICRKNCNIDIILNENNEMNLHRTYKSNFAVYILKGKIGYIAFLKYM
jgi:hypothetical protein